MMFRDYEGLTFDDVLLEPGYSTIMSKDEISTRTSLTKNIRINIPIISAPMDTVTESKMAIAMASLGGVGIIHRYMPIDKQVEEVKKVKETEILSNMPNPSLIDDKLLVGAAIGPKEKEVKRAERLLGAGVDFLQIDSAHAYSKMVIDLLKRLKSFLGDVDIIVGNVATPESIEPLSSAGADGIVVGIGSGSVCTTRLVAGVGIPQLTSLLKCSEKSKELNVPLIADGGIRIPGDVVKALAAGASAVMIGRLLAGTNESPAPLIRKNGKYYKIYRGTVWLSRQIDCAEEEACNSNSLEENIFAEGIETYVPIIGPVSNIIQRLISGIKLGMMYIGARNINELCENVIFVKISENAKRESKYKNTEVISLWKKKPVI